MSGSKTASDKYDYMAKVVILGDSAVGKTNILLRYTSQEYKPTHVATVGVDFKIKTVQIGATRIKLQLWDTAGQERFKTITETYYKGASGIVLVLISSLRSTQSTIGKHSIALQPG
jgi:small GTP-binding protein